MKSSACTSGGLNLRGRPSSDSSDLVLWFDEIELLFFHFHPLKIPFAKEGPNPVSLRYEKSFRIRLLGF